MKHPGSTVGRFERPGKLLTVAIEWNAEAKKLQDSLRRLPS